MECKVRDIDVHYEEIGTGRPLLILHGWTGNARMAMADFEPSFEGRTGWRRLYPDMPGHGQTPVPDWLENHDVVLEMLLEFIDAVAPGERFVLGGISWGGYLARGILHHRPQPIDGLVLCVPVTEKEFDKRIVPEHQVLHHDEDFEAALQPGDEWMGEVSEMLVVQSSALLDSLRRAAADTLPQDPAIVPLYSKNFSFDPDILPEPCPAPTLIVTGRQDNVVGYEQAWPLLDNFPRATFALLDRSGHLLGVEQPLLFQALVSEWLDRVEEYIAQKTP